MNLTKLRAGSLSSVAIASALLLGACGTEPAAPVASPTPSVTVDPGPAIHESLWTFDTGSEIWGAPAVIGDTAFVGSIDGVFRAFDANTGDGIWEFPTGGDIRGTALVDGNNVIFRSDDGFLYALSADGQEQWRTDVGQHAAERDTYDTYSSMPALEGGVLYAGSATGVYAINAADGAVLWAQPAAGIVDTNIAVGDGQVFANSFDNHLYALDAATGAVNWTREYSGEGTTSPAYADGIVVTGSRMAYVQALDATNGEKVWSASYGSSWVQSGAEIHDGVLTVGSSALGVVRQWDLKTGAQTWSTNLGMWPWGIPHHVDGVTYVGTMGDTSHQPWEFSVYALDSATGAVIWKAGTGESATWTPDGYDTYGSASSPVVVGDHVLVTSLDGQVYAFAK